MLKNNYKDKVAIITGGSGVLGFEMAKGLALEGVKVAILGRTEEVVHSKVDDIKSLGGQAIGLIGDVLDYDAMELSKQKVLQTWGKIDILINAAGGNIKGATIQPEDSFFDM